MSKRHEEPLDLTPELTQEPQIGLTEELTHKQPTSTRLTNTLSPPPQCPLLPSQNSEARPQCPTTLHATHTKINPQLSRQPSSTPPHTPLQTAPLSFQERALQQELKSKQTRQAFLPSRLRTIPKTKKSPHDQPKPHTQGPQPQLAPKLQSKVRD